MSYFNHLTRGIQLSTSRVNCIYYLVSLKITQMLLSQVIYVGLDIVTPLISLDLLKYPKLSRDVSFFSFHFSSSII